jgi:hypothetical protein
MKVQNPKYKLVEFNDQEIILKTMKKTLTNAQTISMKKIPYKPTRYNPDNKFDQEYICDNCVAKDIEELYFFPDLFAEHSKNSITFYFCRTCLEEFAKGEGLTFEKYCEINKVVKI